jgi:FkbM family methyltransferase
MLALARSYARLYAAVKDRFDINLPGVGWLARRIRTDAELRVGGVVFHLDHRIASSYGTLLGGQPNEPETPALLARVLDAVHEPVTIVDVGANVGDVVLHVAGHPNAARIVAFEPHPLAAGALRRSAAINGFANVMVHQELVGDGQRYRFDINERNANASRIGGGGTTASVRLDDILADAAGMLIIVIDVEGAEPVVIRGAQATIRRLRPLIVFEYNHVSRAHYELDEIRGLLGDGYEILRLRRDGGLDRKYTESWNCVAIPRGSHLESILLG